MKQALILIADDDQKNQRLASDLLEIRGHATLAARNGEEAVALCRARKPDLVLMDIQMPVMNGYDAAAIIRQDPATAHIPILALTAQAMADDRKKTEQAGFAGYMAKPFDIHVFFDAIETLLARSGRNDRGNQGP